MDWGCPLWRQSSFHRCWGLCCCCPAAVVASRPASSASSRRLRVSPPPSDALPLRGGDALSLLRPRSRWRTASCADAKSRPRLLPGHRVAAGQAEEEELSLLLFAEAGWTRVSRGRERHLGCGTVPTQSEKK